METGFGSAKRVFWQHELAKNPDSKNTVQYKAFSDKYGHVGETWRDARLKHAVGLKLWKNKMTMSLSKAWAGNVDWISGPNLDG